MTLNSTKTVFLTFLFSLLISLSNITYAQTKVGIKAGVNFSNVMMKDEDGNKANTQSMPGIRLGLTADIPVVGDFYIQPAILYSGKGFKQESGGFYGMEDPWTTGQIFCSVMSSLASCPYSSMPR